MTDRPRCSARISTPAPEARGADARPHRHRRGRHLHRHLPRRRSRRADRGADARALSRHGRGRDRAPCRGGGARAGRCSGVTVIHRYGRIVPGDNIVLVVTASSHREAAFAAAEFLMDYLKTRAPFWKQVERARRQRPGSRPRMPTMPRRRAGRQPAAARPRNSRPDAPALLRSQRAAMRDDTMIAVRLRSLSRRCAVILRRRAARRPRVSYFPVPAGAPRTMSRPRPTAPSGTPASARALSAASIRRPARTRRSRSARARAARRDRRAGRRGLDHRRRAERDRALRSEDQESSKLFRAAAGICPTPTSTPASFDKDGILWFTGQNGVYGRVDPKTGKVESWKSPNGAALRHHGDAVGRGLVRLARRRPHRARSTRRPAPRRWSSRPSKGAGPRRVWSDSKGVLWVSFWHSGEVGRYDPAAEDLEDLAAAEQQAAAAIRSMSTTRTRSGSPTSSPTRSCASIRRPRNSRPSRATSGAPQVRQMLGRPGEAWGARIRQRPAGGGAGLNAGRRPFGPRP